VIGAQAPLGQQFLDVTVRKGKVQVPATASRIISGSNWRYLNRAATEGARSIGPAYQVTLRCSAYVLTEIDIYRRNQVDGAKYSEPSRSTLLNSSAPNVDGDRQLGIFRNSEYRKYSVNGILTFRLFSSPTVLNLMTPKSPALRLPTFGDVGPELTNPGGRPPGEISDLCQCCGLELGFGVASTWSLSVLRPLSEAAFVRRGRNGDVELFRARALIRTVLVQTLEKTGALP
jgi:hypothetical protein